MARPLEGEDIQPEQWKAARHWMSIYDDLIHFKLGLLERVKRELPKLHPVAQRAAGVDVTFIEAQMAGYTPGWTCGTSGSGSSTACGLIQIVTWCATRGTRLCSPIESSNSCNSSWTIPTASIPRRRSHVSPGRTPRCFQRRSATTCFG